MTSTDCLLLPAAGREAGEAAARSLGLEPQLAVTKQDCADRLDEIRSQARELGLGAFVVHSADRDRQPMPQFFDLVALRLGLGEARFLSDTGAPDERVSRAGLAARVGAIPFEVARGLGTASAEGARLARLRRRAPAAPAAPTEPSSVLAIWHGSPGETVGGSVTHISGVLSALRRLGLRVGLVTMAPPPPQLASVVDDLEVVPPMPRSARVTGEVAAACANRYLRAAGARLLERMRPDFVYQRYDAFITCGVDLAERAEIPSVLEWNASEVWTRANWHVQRRFKRVLEPLLEAGERYVVERATVVAAVSDHAADMAVDAGAARDRVIVVPNGADVEAIDAERAGVERSDSRGPVVGWVGSFGSWHGADVLVRAMPHLPDEVSAVMVGEGGQRQACEELAEELGVAGRIEFTGALPHHEAVARLAACHVLASPHVELPGQAFFGSPTKLFEYMALDRPIVASSLEQIGDVLEDGRTAKMVTPGDVAGLAGGIREVLALPDRGAALGAAARREAEERHTWERRGEAILAGLQAGAPAADEHSVKV